jgi:hypothetical protein
LATVDDALAPCDDDEGRRILALLGGFEGEFRLESASSHPQQTSEALNAPREQQKVAKGGQKNDTSYHPGLKRLASRHDRLN